MERSARDKRRAAASITPALADKTSSSSSSRPTALNNPPNFTTTSNPTGTSSFTPPSAHGAPTLDFSPPSSSSNPSSASSSSLPRVTRSAARRASAAGSSNLTSTGQSPTATATPTPARPPTRKRKPADTPGSSDHTPEPAKATPRRRTKRQKVTAAASSEPALAEPARPPPSTRRTPRDKAAAMSHLPASSGSPSEVPAAAGTSASAKRKSSRNKKPAQDFPPATSSSTQGRRSKKNAAAKDTDVTMADISEKPTPSGEDVKVHRPEEDPDSDEGEDELGDDYDDEDPEGDDDPFTNSYFGGASGATTGISNTLRALSGMMSGASSRLRDILNNLKQKDDPSIQLIALQELSELLLVSTEDNLSGHFSPDQFVKELVSLMQPSDFGEENPEMMLLACRCIANLMEALPASTANVVYGGAVPVLCQKLLEIHYIDLAEQALSTLEKISVEFPASIVREGGLTACLTYLDFFATSTQRTAVTTAANCCRNIPEESFPVIRDVMPILLNVLSSNDQKVVEQACLCVSRVVESFKYRQDKLEELVSPDLLRAITRLLLPGSTNLIGPSIHTQFLRVLSFTARASPKLSAELLKMNIVDTLYQILTGVSPPTGMDDVADKIDSVVIMQALIHRPRDQVFETLNVICELLPTPPSDTDLDLHDSFEVPFAHIAHLETGSSRPDHPSPNEKRIELLEGCKEELKRFAIVLLPTLTDAYSSTVNLSVRQKVLNAQLRLLSHLDVTILEDALRTVPYASYLASILSQQDHPSLVLAALQASELLLKRLEHIYRYQFHREGVMSEIAKLASAPLAKDVEKTKHDLTVPKHPAAATCPPTGVASTSTAHPDGHAAHEHPDGRHESGDTSDDDDGGDEHDDDHEEDVHDDLTASPVSSGHSSSSSIGRRNHRVVPVVSHIQDLVTRRAKRFMAAHETEESGKEMRERALTILQDLRGLASKIEECYVGDGEGSGLEAFQELATYFEGDALESITSAELLNSGIVRVLLEVFTSPNEHVRADSSAHFLEVFMSKTIRSTPMATPGKSPATSFGALVYKLQDLLSRSEHFEVMTVHQNSFDGNRGSAASMLAKQIRLKLVADDESDIPRPYRNIMVSIHAIATFKALDDYLRPRISLAERPRGARHREGMSSALAAFAAAAGLPSPHQRLERSEALGGATASTPTAPGATVSGSSTRKASGSRSKPVPGETSIPHEKPSTARRSSRRHHQSQPPPPPPPPSAPEPEPEQDPLECADEKQITDDEEDTDDASALDAIVDDLDEEMDDDAPADPTAVNLEVAATGKITARKEDGTRVATPSHTLASSSSTPQPPPAPGASGSTPSASNRHMSYAAAIQAIPQDWHIEFSIAGQPISNETTIYRAVHHQQPQAEESALRSVWSGIHPIKFKRVAGPPPTSPHLVTFASEPVSETSATGLPDSLDKHPTTSVILRLLNILHALNANLDDVLDDSKQRLQLSAEPLAQFVNTKLTAKLNRQLEEPLIVASNCLPTWSEDLARLYPFLFPFETRHLFLQSTSFGYARSMTRWQNAQPAVDARQGRHRDDRPFLGRLQRQKVRISRTRILESAVKVMELYGASPSVLEVEYFEEVGTGLGPTLEFYSTVSKEFSKKKLKLWRENDMASHEEYAFGKRGLFPAPMSAEQAKTEPGKKTLHLFKMLGKFVARSMLDSRIIDVSFNPTFFRIGDGVATVPPSLATVKTVDEGLSTSLKLVRQFALAKRAIDEDGQLTAAAKARAIQAIHLRGAHIEDLGLDFTLPGYPSIELIADGSNTPVNIDNVGLYVDRVIDLTLGSGVQRQVDAFRAGFSSVFPYSALKAFTPDELVMLFGRVEEDWSLETLMDSIKADHGFNMDSKSVKNLLQAMSELSPTLRRDFLQFVTGSPKLPIGGFRSLTPMFTVVCKPSEPPYTSDDYLPSVMTCVNYLKLPDYTNLDIMRSRLGVAISEGQGAFHLS